MSERALLFGPECSLLGILTGGGARSAQAPAVGVIVLNAGFLHRIGPNRLHVKIARHLAALGLTVLRFDLSGIGDSAARRDGLGYAESTEAETRAAMDLLERECGLRQFVLMGICSGADSILRLVRRDPRIVGIVPIESLTFETRGYTLDYLWRRALLPRTWGKLLRGRIDLASKIARVFWTPRRALATPGEEQALWTLPPARDVLQAIDELAARGGRACLIYSTNEPGYFHYRRRLRRPLRPLVDSGHVEVRLIDATDHLFTPLSRQAWLLDQLGAWLLAPSNGHPAAGSIALLA